ncbi:MAG: hypothetical protein QOG21_263 [Actinomycetota bacterium]|jgi:hypothetical protein|nr:hypothetical protein [Actinomycetota bacterium]
MPESVARGADTIRIALADGAAYLILIQRQSEPGSSVVWWVFSLITMAGLAAVGGWILSPGRAATVTLVASTIILGIVGVLGIFSIGLPLLLASGFALLGVRQSRGRAAPVGSAGRVVVAALAAAGVLVAAFFLVQISAGGQTVGVSCTGSAPGLGMPSVRGDGTDRRALRLHACRTITSP